MRHSVLCSFLGLSQLYVLGEISTLPEMLFQTTESNDASDLDEETAEYSTNEDYPTFTLPVRYFKFTYERILH